MPTSPVLLKSSRLRLRHATPSDIPAILSYYEENQAHLAPFEPLKPSAFYTHLYWDKEIYQRLIDTQEGKALKLFIFLKRSPQSLIGTINFSNFTRGVFQNCTVGYSLSAQYQGQGYMYEAMQVSIRYVFSSLKFHRIGANYLPHNQRSGNLLKRLGFSVNGYAPDYLYIAGQWQDHILTSLLNPATPRKLSPALPRAIAQPTPPLPSVQSLEPQTPVSQTPDSQHPDSQHPETPHSGAKRSDTAAPTPQTQAISPENPNRDVTETPPTSIPTD
ncbi:MAG: GNAT family N-acetyltransferase [Cyanobacteria bacterium J06597_16]